MKKQTIGMDTEPKEESFKASEIEDVRIIIRAKGKHYSVVGNKELCEEEGLDAKDIRLALLYVLLKTHNIVFPSLEDIKANKDV